MTPESAERWPCGRGWTVSRPWLESTEEQGGRTSPFQRGLASLVSSPAAPVGAERRLCVLMSLPVTLQVLVSSGLGHGGCVSTWGPSLRWGLGFAAHPGLSEPTENQAVQVGSGVTGGSVSLQEQGAGPRRGCRCTVQEDRNHGPKLSSGPGEAWWGSSSLVCVAQVGHQVVLSAFVAKERPGDAQTCPGDAQQCAQGIQGQDVARSPPAGLGILNGFMRTNSNPCGHPGCRGRWVGGVSAGGAGGSLQCQRGHRHLSLNLNLLG